MSTTDLSDAAQNYLKVIWGLGEWTDEPATTGRIAERMGVTPATVSVGVKRLAEQGLVEHQPYGSIALTAEGRRHALDIVRRHRLIETFLVQVLHYRWDQVHEDAEHMEHAVSDLMIERLAALLGNPTSDPHGDPIPGPDGTIVRPETIPLSQVPDGMTVRIEQIADSNPSLLQELADKRAGLGSVATVLATRPYDTSTSLSFEDGARMTLGPEAAESIRVSMKQMTEDA